MRRFALAASWISLTASCGEKTVSVDFGDGKVSIENSAVISEEPSPNRSAWGRELVLRVPLPNVDLRLHKRYGLAPIYTQQLAAACTDDTTKREGGLLRIGTDHRYVQTYLADTAPANADYFASIAIESCSQLKAIGGKGQPRAYFCWKTGGQGTCVRDIERPQYSATLRFPVQELLSVQAQPTLVDAYLDKVVRPIARLNESAPQ